ncbi:hypothetical protein TSA6c_00500 [Azospirillum sp. TSA6c]|uniref:hypothetical protein n=1 Tax=Azospirillum sp. TSA6c TaxID=709813 RepID=UPI000D6127FB|nr:hypothetical protein [Azospirillum sp. TSA6c]PWC54379.1 hypothetical protein TSA6c_00500 [Azospirillum sp. TSA6c]
MATLPISSKDTVEFRPASAAVKAAREALEKAQAATNEADAALNAVTQKIAATPEDAPENVAHSDEFDTAAAKANSANLELMMAQKALDAAEEARAKADPSFSLIVPTARTMALVDYDMEMDPDLPTRAPLKDVIGDLLAEAKDNGLSDGAISAIERAAALADAGDSVTGDDWDALAKAAGKLYSWRVLMAPYKLYANLEAGYRIRRHLVLHSSRKVLSEADLETPEVKPYLGAINAELVRLSTVSEADAKN